MNWTLEDVHNLECDQYDELVAWVNEQAERAEHGESTDADAIVAALDAKAARSEDDGDD